MPRFVRFGLEGIAVSGLFLCGTTAATGQGAGAIIGGALVADPNNFFLTPFAPCDGCAARLP